MLAGFGRLTAGEAMPDREQLRTLTSRIKAGPTRARDPVRGALPPPGLGTYASNGVVMAGAGEPLAVGEC